MRAALVGVIALVLAVTGVARAEAPLVLEGEPPTVLDGLQWASFSGPKAIAASADGSALATVSEDGLLRLWDPRSGRELRRIAAPKQLQVALNAKGTLVVAAGRDGSITVWETATGNVVAHKDADNVAISTLAISADGKALAFGAARRATSYWVFGDGSLPLPWLDVDDTRGVAISPDGKTIAVAQSNHDVLLLDIASRKTAKTLAADSGSFGAVAFSPDGKSVYAGADSGALTVWDVATGRPRTIEAHSQTVTGIAFSGEFVITAATDHTVKLWNAATLQPVRKSVSPETCCTAIAIAPPGTVNSLTGRGIGRWDIASGTAMTALRGQTAAVGAVATAGLNAHSLAMISADGTVRIFSGESGTVTRSIDNAAGQAVAMSADEKLVAYADAERTIHIVDVSSGKDTATIPSLESVPLALAFSPNNKEIAAAEGSQGVHAWDVDSGQRLFDMPAKNSVSAIAWSGDSTTLVASDGASVVIRRAASADKLADKVDVKKIDVPATAVSVSISDDGKHVAAGLADGNMRVWDGAGVEANKLAGGPGPVFATLTHDGRTLVSASADGGVHFWLLPAGKDSGKVQDADGIPTGVTMTVDDSAAIVSGSGGEVHLWDIKDHKERALYRVGPTGWIARISGRVLRGDQGAFLLKKDDTGALVPVAPPATNVPPELTAAPGASTPTGQGGMTGKIVLTVSNGANGGRAYWVTVKPTLPPGMALQEIPIIPRIEPGAKETLSIPVSYTGTGALAPQDLRLTLQLVHARGDGPIVPASVHVVAPVVEAKLVSVESSGTQLPVAIELSNTGDEATGPLEVTPSFVDKAGGASTEPTIQIQSLKPGDKAPLRLTGTSDAKSLTLTIQGSQSAGFKWSSTIPLSKPISWAPIFGVLIGILVLGGVFYFVRISRNPIVLQVGKDPNQLRLYDLRRAKDVNAALNMARRLKIALTAAKLSETKWNRAVQSATTPDGAAAAFSETVGARRQDQALGTEPAWNLELPELQIRFPKRTAIAIVTGQQAEQGAAVALATAIHQAGEGPTVALAIDLTVEQNAKTVLQAVPRISFVVLSANELRDILFADEPIVLLQRLIAAQRSLAELSPYQSAAGVEDQALFFGREKELRAIADRVLRNFLVVAPRQMGKSSLLKAVQRRLAARPDVEVHLITLVDDDLPARVARQLNRPKPESSDSFLEIAAGTRRKPRVWLLDESDRYIVRDARSGYPVSLAMRTLSEEGRAYFVLAGFWHLYAAAYLNANNPLRNFGELLRLEPLDRNAAKDLATKPMEMMGLQYEDTSLIDTILNETGCRAHLVTEVCRALIDGLGPEDRVMTADNVNTALYRNPLLKAEFSVWRREPLARAIVRLTMLEGPATRGEMRERILQHGVDVSNDIFSSTLDRLDLGYLLTAGSNGKLDCPVPLLKRFVEQEDSLENGLAHDLDEFLALQLPGVSSSAA